MQFDPKDSGTLRNLGLALLAFTAAPRTTLGVIERRATSEGITFDATEMRQIILLLRAASLSLLDGVPPPPTPSNQILAHIGIPVAKDSGHE